MVGNDDKKKKRKTKDTAGQRTDALPDMLREQHTHVVCGEHMNYHVRPCPALQALQAAAADAAAAAAQHLSASCCSPRINATSDRPWLSQTNTRTSAGTYMALGVDNSWSQEEFEARFSVEGMCWATLPRPQDGRQDRSAIQFDLLNVDPAIANAFRRILISDLPTVAIEHVYMVNNTSVMTVRPAASAVCQSCALPCLLGPVW